MVLVFDGGCGSEAVRRNYISDEDPLWSARMLVDNSDGIVEIHKSYLNAGANAITACTYQASVDGFMKYLNCSLKEAESYLRRGATLCKQACEEFPKTENGGTGKKLFTCAALGPYGVFLSDGSEYSGSYIDKVPFDEIKDWHERRLSILSDENLDYYMFVTMPALGEIQAILPLFKKYGNLKFIVSFSCQDGERLYHGEKITDAVYLLNQCDSVVAIGVNCTSPLFISSLIEKIKPITTKEILIMPNSGEVWNEKSWHGNRDVKDLASYVSEWMDKGATWLGSCCRTTPEDTKKICEEVVRKMKI